MGSYSLIEKTSKQDLSMMFEFRGRERSCEVKSTAGNGSDFPFPFSLFPDRDQPLTGTRRTPLSPSAFASISEADAMIDKLARSRHVSPSLK